MIQESKITLMIITTNNKIRITHRWWFAPKMSAHLYHDFFPAKNNNGFLFGSPIILILLFFVIAVMYALIIVICATLMLSIWTIQIVVLVPVGIITLVKLIRK